MSRYCSKLGQNAKKWIVVWHIAINTLGCIVTYVTEHTWTYCRISEHTGTYCSISLYTGAYCCILYDIAAYRFMLYLRIREHLSECWSKFECCCTFRHTVIYFSILPVCDINCYSEILDPIRL